MSFFKVEASSVWHKKNQLSYETMTEGPKNKRKVSMAPGTVDNEEDALRFTRKRRQSNAKELAAMMTMPE